MFGRARPPQCLRLQPRQGNIPPTKCWSSVSRRATSSLAVLFARHRTNIYRWLFRFVRNEIAAEDLLSVWQQAGRFEGRSALTTWLLSIARFKALSARRRASMRS